MAILVCKTLVQKIILMQRFLRLPPLRLCPCTFVKSLVRCSRAQPALPGMDVGVGSGGASEAACVKMSATRLLAALIGSWDCSQHRRRAQTARHRGKLLAKLGKGLSFRRGECEA